MEDHNISMSLRQKFERKTDLVFKYKRCINEQIAILNIPINFILNADIPDDLSELSEQ